MRTDEFGIEELDTLISRNDRRSVDPEPQRTMGMDPRIVRELVSDHIRSLRNINRSLPDSPDLDRAIAALEDEYYKAFGQRLTELLTAPAAQVRAAVLELRRQLTALLKEPSPDLSYRKIDNIMKGICDQHKCSTKSLHDLFVETLGMTPDDWVADKHRESRKSK